MSRLRRTSTRRRKPGDPRRVLNLTGALGEAMDAACALDRLYFLEHPEEKVYVRVPYPDEFWGLSVAPGSVVEVTWLAPGIRSRRLLLMEEAGR